MDDLAHGLIFTCIALVAPAYDTQAQLTSYLAADLIYEIMSMMVKRGE